MSRSTPIEDFSMLGPADALALDQIQEQPQTTLQTPEPIVAGKRGRKRKLPQQDANVTASELVTARQAPFEEDVSQVLDSTQQSMMSMPPPQMLEMPSPHPVDTDLSMPRYDLTPSLPDGFATPMGLSHGGLTPMHGDFSAFTPLDHHGIMTPQHSSLEQIESIPNLPVDQVSSILNGAEMEDFANMGYSDGGGMGSGMSERIANDWNDDYDFPASVGPAVSYTISFIPQKKEQQIGFEAN